MWFTRFGREYKLHIVIINSKQEIKVDTTHRRHVGFDIDMVTCWKDLGQQQYTYSSYSPTSRAILSQSDQNFGKIFQFFLSRNTFEAHFDHFLLFIQRPWKYSGTPLIRTPMGPAQVSVLTGCPY